MEQVKYLLEYVPIRRFSRNTRSVILGYLKHEIEEGTEDFIKQHLADLQIFFYFLDEMAKIQKKGKA